MMSRSSSLLGLCQRVVRMNCCLKGLDFQPLFSTELAAPTATGWFSTYTRNSENMKIITDKFDDSNFSIDENPFRENLEGSRKSTLRRDYVRETDVDFDFRNRKSRRWSNEKPRVEFDTDDNSDFHGRDSFSQHRPKPNDRVSSNYDKTESVDLFLQREFGLQRGGERRSFEDLWNQVKEQEVEFRNTATIEKDFYSEHPDVSNRPQEEIQKFMDSHEITVTGRKSRRPIFEFEETGFPDTIMETLKEQFHKPTPIQCIGWPHALSGCDVVGIAQTGSGKTLSFVLPAIFHVMKRRDTAKGHGPIALVMCPTRELAVQCHRVLQLCRSSCNIKSAVVYGGQSRIVQEDKLARPGLEIVVATPGRLLDFLSTNVISLERCSFLVLDEADRMLDMGFEPQIRAIMSQTPPNRQVLMWSATWPEEIQDLASDFLNDFVHMKIGSQIHTVNKDVMQEFQYCEPRNKVDTLMDHLANTSSSGHRPRPPKTLVFCHTKAQCSRLQGILHRNGFRCDIIHGDKSQRHRDDVMSKFRSGLNRVLIASDVAARGIDVNDIEYVINYDLPQNIDSYIHRVGRTGRAGKKGIAISYITLQDLDMMEPLIKVLRDVDHEVPNILYELVEKRYMLKSYRKMERRSSRPSRRQHPNFRF